MKLIYRYISLFMMLVVSVVATAQTSVTMVNNDTVHIEYCDSPTGVIYDDGGPNGSYSNNFEGWVIIHAPAGIVLTLSGGYTTENCCDHLWVYDGRGAGGQLLVGSGGVSGSGSLSVQSTTGWLSVRFHTDGSVTNSGFALSWAGSGTAVSCSNRVTGLTASAITTTTATLSWSAPNAAGPFNFVVGGIPQTVSGTSLTLTGLNPNTRYPVQVCAAADAASLCCIATTTFRTACGTMAPPITEDFDSYGHGPDVLPSCWVRVTNYDAVNDQPQIVDNPTSGNTPGALRMYCGANEAMGHYGIVYSPVIGSALNTLYLRMKIRGSSNGDKLEIGTASDTLNSNFVPFDTIEITNYSTWQDVIIDFSSYTGTGNRIAFRMLRRLQPYNNQNIYIDGVTIEPCGVWNMRLVRRDIHDMWITWDSVGTPMVNIEYGPTGFLAGTGITLTDVVPPLHVEGLQPGTSYDFNFYTTCAAGAEHPDGTLTVSTLERNNLALNYCEGFEEGSLPSGWRAPVTYDGTPTTTSSESYSGGRSLRIRSSYYGSTLPVAVMPLVDTVPVSQLSLSFMAKGSSGSYLLVGVMNYPEDTASFVVVDSVPVTAVWSSATVSLAPYQGTGRYLALRAYDYYSNSIYIDNLQLGTCMLANLSRTNITSNSVELQWDLVTDAFHGDSAIIEYGPSGFAAGTGTRLALPVRGSGVQSVGGRQRHVVTGLESDSLYQFAVYGQCNVMELSCDQFRLSARTLAENITLPYCVDFEQFDAGTFPIGWERPSVYSSRPRISDSRAHSGNRSMELYSASSSPNSHSTLVLPLIDDDNFSSAQLSLWAYKESSYYSILLEVGVMTSPSDESSFAVLDSILLLSTGWHHYVADLSAYSGTGRYVAIRQRDSYYNTVWLDDIEVSTCTVKNVRHHSENSHGVTIVWQPAGSSYSGAVLEFGPHGFIPGTGTSDTLDANTFSLTLDTLSPGTTYDYYLHSLCANQSRTCQFEPRTFSTFEEPYAATVCENFNTTANYSLPSNWARPLLDNDRPYVYDHSLRLYSSSSGSLAVMPFLEESDLSSLSLHASLYGECSNRYVLLGIMSDPLDTSTFVLLDTLFAGNYTWRESSVSLASYTGTARHLAFWMKRGQGWCQVNIDNITVSRCGLSDIRTYSPTTDAVMLSWNADAATERVELHWRRSDLPADSSIVVDSVVSPYRLEGLEPATSYSFSLLPHCASSSRSCSNVEHSFSTLQEPLSDGWCENFESATSSGVLPGNWTLLRRYNNNYPSLDYDYNSPYPSDGIWYLRFRANASSCNMISLPWCADTLSNLILSFNLRSNNEYHPETASLIVGVMALPYDSASFVPIDTVHPAFTYSNVSVDFSSYSGEGRHIAFLFKDENDYTTYVDELSLSRCRATDLQSDMITNHSVRLQWNKIGYSDETLIGWKADGVDTLQYQTSNGTSATIENLEASTHYTFYVWAACQDTALLCQASRIEATTLALPMAVPYCNDFESEANDVMPAGWSRPYGNSAPRVYNYNYYAHSGNRSLYFYANNDRSSMAVMPMLDPDSVPSLSDVVVDGWMRSWNDRLRLVVGVMSDPVDTSSFVAVDSLYVNGFLHFKVPLTTYSGMGRYVTFKVVATANTSGEIFLDDVNLRTCYISRVWTHHPTQNSLDVSWEGGNASGVFIEYSPVSGPDGDFVAGTGTLIHASSSPFTVMGLSSATWYAVHVYPDCSGANDACNYETSVLQTLHPAVDVSYCENFDSYNTDVFPSNWRRLSTYETTNNPSIYQYQSHSAPYSCRFRAYDTNYAFVVMPQLHLEEECAVVDSIYLNFWTRYNWGRDYGRLIVGTMQDIYNPSSFVVVDTLVDTINDWQHHTVAVYNLNTTNTYIAFKLVNVNHNSSELYLDDLCVEKCVATDVTISEVSQNSVTVTWTSNGVDSILCEYAPQGTPAGSGTQIVMTHSPFVISGLEDGTDYQFAFSSICGCSQYGEVYFPGGGSSGWNYWGGYYWGWGYGGHWGWGWWGGRSWWEIPPGHPEIIPPVVDAQTQAPDITVPYCESFEDYDTLQYPSNWRRMNNASSQFPQINQSNHHTGDHCLDFYTTSGHYCFATLPSVDTGQITDMVLTFNAYSNNSYATYHHVFQVGVMSNPDDTSTFVPVDTIHLAQRYRWQSFTVDFANYTGEGRFIAFRFMPIYDGYHYYIDDLYLGRCAIENLRYSELPSGGINVQWDNIHTADSIVVQYGSQQTTLAASQSSMTFPSLNADSSYDIYVTPYCDTAHICNPYMITVNPTMTLPYCEDFEGYPAGGYPDRMRTKYNYGSWGPTIETQDGSQMFLLSSGSGTNNNTMIMLQPLAGNESLNGKWLNMRLRSYNHDNISLDFGVWPDTGDVSTFVSMTTPSLRNTVDNQVEEFNVQLSGYSGTANRLVIRVNSTYYYSHIWIDRMVLSSEPYPMGIRDSEEGYATRHIYWDSGAYYTLEYYYTESDIRTAQSDSCHAVLTGLSSDKEYKVYFITPDGERFCQPYTFTTPQVFSVPYCEDFQSYSYYDVPESWRRINDGDYYCMRYDGVRPRVWADGNGSTDNRYLDFYHSCRQIL